ncbi:hypothetical protein Efla_003445 [Eimeria flavescens]
MPRLFLPGGLVAVRLRLPASPPLDFSKAGRLLLCPVASGSSWRAWSLTGQPPGRCRSSSCNTCHTASSGSSNNNNHSIASSVRRGAACLPRGSLHSCAAKWRRQAFHSSAQDAAPEAKPAAAETAAAAGTHASQDAAAAADEPRMPTAGWAVLCCSLSLLVGGVGAGVWLLLDEPEPFKLAWDTVQKDPRVLEALGGAVSHDWWWGGYVHKAEARIKMSLRGPEGQRGHVTCDLMVGPDGKWQILLLNFVPLDRPPQGTANPMANVVALLPEQLPRSKQQENFIRGCPVATKCAEQPQA